MKGVRWSAADVIPCLANSPSATTIWQRPQIPRPPQTESRSTPSERAASSRFVSCANRPRLPEGVKTTSASAASLTAPAGSRRAPRPAAALAAAAAARRARRPSCRPLA